MALERLSKDQAQYKPQISKVSALDTSNRLKNSSEITQIHLDLIDKNGGSSRQSYTNENDEKASEISNFNISTAILTSDLENPYHIFTLWQKRRLAIIVSLAGVFNPLASNIYLPVLVSVSRDLHVDISLISLTITIYMVIQGLAPSFWGTYSDIVGRRSILIFTFLVFLIANIGLAFANNFTILLIFRGIQAAGSAATTSIGAGVIGDISTAAERGGLIGIFGGIRMLAQAIGPVFGGILTQYLGFHSIFWALFIFGAITLFLILVFLPETLRSIAGNGSVRLQGTHKPLIYIFKGQPGVVDDSHFKHTKERVSIRMFFEPLKFLFEKDVFVTLFFGSIVYAVWNMITASTSSLFDKHYNLSQILLGVTFIPNGAGCLLGSYFTGTLMDRDFVKTETEYRKSHSIPETVMFNRKDLGEFPIEQARLRNVWWMVLVFVVTVSVYGLSLKTIIAVPLILQFIISYTATAISTLNSALIIDLYPGASASATAVNNLIRCSIGAIGVASVDHLVNAMNPIFAFLILAGLVIVVSPLLIVEWVYGKEWRKERGLVLQKKNDIKKEEAV